MFSIAPLVGLAKTDEKIGITPKYIAYTVMGQL